MDTTLRDGEQTSGVSFSAEEKLSLTSLLLEDLKVDRVEIASALVSEGEFEAVRKVTNWAQRRGRLHQIEVLGFVDGQRSLRWIQDAGCRVLNLLCKGSLKHVTEQLRKTPQEHLAGIEEVVRHAEISGITVNIYLEDWSNGMLHSPDYVFFMMDRLRRLPVRRIMLPDTLGILSPEQTAGLCSQMLARYLEIHFDFHAHNDYDLAVANVMMAVQAGAKGIHTTVNGLGERAGNAPLSSVLAVLHDLLNVKTGIVEKNINKISRMVESSSGIHIPANKPVIGENVFTQCAGIHADGDKKNNLYFNDLLPERFGRMREYALGKMSGKANIQKNLEMLGIVLDEESMHKVTERIIELGDKKQLVTQDELPYIISDVLKHVQNAKIKVVGYALSVSKGLRPMAAVKLEIEGRTYEATAAGDGQYNAFTKALWKIYNRQLSKPTPVLTNYVVTIPPGGQTDALVQTTISWNFQGKDFKTTGLDPDQTEAAIKATVKMLNIIEDML
ncbi:MAG: 2-isopropylmalate synthase [Bacteroidales bacterium]|jgi:D-citramalate synthase|nr:2-isopropylmalate synthase [Bacteroidales bacterium]